MARKKLVDPDNKESVDPDGKNLVQPDCKPRVVVTDIIINGLAIFPDGTQVPVILDCESFLLDNLQIKKIVVPLGS